jgi:DNA-binding LytR/AlgR family response regulator
MRILIIEDELPAARQLTKLIQAKVPNATILDTLDSVESAVQWLNSFDAPDLIFMDIQIADGLSFDIFKQTEVRSPVIFTTAFDQYAIQAFKVNAVDYLLKPIDPDDLGKALEKIKAAQSTNSLPDLKELLRYMDKGRQYKDRFLVKTGQHFIMVPIQDIAFFHSSDGLTMVHTHAGKKHFVEYTLDELQDLLHPESFYRINRSTFLSVQSIRAIHPHLNGRLKLDIAPTLTDEVFVSRERVGEFKIWLGA